MTRRTFAQLTLTAAAGRVLSAPKLATPTREQINWQNMELEMFLCLDPCTWQNREYDNHSTPLDKINPVKLDTDQWVEVALSMGAGQIIFVAKHTGGFCWWRTPTSVYGIKDTPWHKGKGDVMALLARSCHRRGIRLGVYLSPQDDVYGAKVSGKCASPEAQARYDQVYRQQLTELLGRYGEISEVWFDGSTVAEVGDILRRYVPHAMVFQGKHATIRWVGSENGIAPYPAWNAVPAAAARSGASTAKDGTPDGDVWLPIECDTTIRNTWFWNSKNANTLKSLDLLMSTYRLSVGHGAVLLLNNAPDTSGLIPEADARRTAEFGAEVRRRFYQPIVETSGQGDTVELRLPRPARIDHVITMEDIAQGERVREYSVEGIAGGEWRELARGSAVGHKKIDSLAPAEVSALRLRVARTAGSPRIRKFAACPAPVSCPA